MTNTATGLLICSDLMFISKVTGLAGSLGFRVDVTNAAQGASKAAEGGYACVMVDLSLQSLAVADVVGSLKNDPPPPVIAFGPHVDTSRLEEARQAGCREVFSRNSFNSNLAEILKKYLGQ